MFTIPVYGNDRVSLAEFDVKLKFEFFYILERHSIEPELSSFSEFWTISAVAKIVGKFIAAKNYRKNRRKMPGKFCVAHMLFT